MRVVFFGTPQFAILPLLSIIKSRHSVVAVVSQPDRAKDRKGQLLPTPLKAVAAEAGLTVLQPESVRAFVGELKKLDADIFVTAAYGQILSQEVLDIPRHGVINIHGSLLPEYRGSSPVQHAILDGKTRTGITIMQTELGLDSGDIILQQALEIGKDETAAELLERMSALGASLVVTALDQIEDGVAEKTPQDHAKATKCGKLSKESMRLCFSLCADTVCNRIRATGGFTMQGGRLLKISRAAVACFDAEGQSAAESRAVGELFGHDGRLFVRCGEGSVEILQLTPEGGKPMSGQDFLRGIKSDKPLITE